MKNSIIIITGALLLSFFSAGSAHAQDREGNVTDKYLTVTCSPDLLPVATSLAKNYNLVKSGEVVRIENMLPGEENYPKQGHTLFLVSSIYLSSIGSPEAEKAVVAKDIIVPVMNAGNPFREDIMLSGIPAAKFSSAMAPDSQPRWSTLVADAGDHPVHFLFLKNISTLQSLASFLDISGIDPQASIVNNRDEMIRNLKGDPYAIGFCHLADILDPVSGEFVPGIAIVPLDKDANGQLDYYEDIYSTPERFTRGVWVGKYPRELVTPIYAVSSIDGTRPGAAFIKWILTDGQYAFKANGHSQLAVGEARSNLEKITPEKVVLETPGTLYAGLKAFLVILIVSILVGIILEMIILYRRFRKSDRTGTRQVLDVSFDKRALNVPRGLFFDKTHTWAFLQADGKVKVGLDAFMARVTGPLTGIRMKEPGEKVKKGEIVISIIQKGKQLNIKAPVSGTVLENNRMLLKNASLIHSDPYTEGIYMIEPSNWLREIQLMYMSDRFSAWLRTELSRLKDFFAMEQKEKQVQLAHLTYQDGGEMKEGILQGLGPEVWEDFQSHFIDTTT